jgi:hypothetical protein
MTESFWVFSLLTARVLIPSFIRSVDIDCHTNLSIRQCLNSTDH